jgi:hypothetical protein
VDQAEQASKRRVRNNDLAAEMALIFVKTL